MNDWDSVDWLRCGCICLTGLVLGWLGVDYLGARKECRYRQGLIEQCIEDGRREYECVALLRAYSSGSTLVPMPVVIPGR